MPAEFADRRVLVMGLGRFGGGVGVAGWLAMQGAEVIVSDRADESDLAESIGQLEGLGIQFRCGEHNPFDLGGVDLLVVSPAVDKRNSAFVDLARARGIPITSEMNLFFERCRGRIVGVTGTTGKSTTCAMLFEILKTAGERGELRGRKTWLGGNIGRSLLAEVDRIAADDLVVLELSSFQLEDLGTLEKSPPVAVITNFSPKHLDRHGSPDDYLGCKLNICRYQRAGDFVVVGVEDLPPTAHHHPVLDITVRDTREPLSPCATSSTSNQDSPLRTSVRQITERTGARLTLADHDEGLGLKVLGPHNRRNAALAARVAESLGIARETVIQALADFDGLPHRLQFVARVGGAEYYNDSKATSPEAVAAALSAFDRPVILIVGGQERPEPWDAALAHRPRIKHAICTGENRDALAAMFEGTTAATLEQAVSDAAHRADQGDVVLFSPGCPSFDQFVNYEARGDAFVRLVKGLCPAGLAPAS